MWGGTCHCGSTRRVTTFDLSRFLTRPPTTLSESGCCSRPCPTDPLDLRAGARGRSRAKLLFLADAAFVLSAPALWALRIQYRRQGEVSQRNAAVREPAELTARCRCSSPLGCPTMRVDGPIVHTRYTMRWSAPFGLCRCRRSPQRVVVAMETSAELPRYTRRRLWTAPPS